MQFNIPAEYRNASGVYIIRNSVNAKVYVGSAVCFWKRYSQHKRDLASDKHNNDLLQRHCNKYGIGTLSFHLLELVEQGRHRLAEAEQSHLIAFDAANRKKGFCIVPQVFPVMLHSEETKRKISVAGKGRITQEETKRKLSVCMRGRKFSEEHKQKLSVSMKNRAPLTEDARARISLALKGRSASEESRQKMSDAQKSRAPFQKKPGKKCQ